MIWMCWLNNLRLSYINPIRCLIQWMNGVKPHINRYNFEIFLTQNSLRNGELTYIFFHCHFVNRLACWMSAKNRKLRNKVLKIRCLNSSWIMVLSHFRAHWPATPFTWIECFFVNTCHASMNIYTIASLMYRRARNCANDGISHFSQKSHPSEMSIVDWMISKKASKSSNITKILCFKKANNQCQSIAYDSIVR